VALSHLVVPTIICTDSKDNYGRFVAEPLDKGFGVTLGNTLRRVLLGHLQGAAVTRVKIEGIQHEFSTIPAVKEDAIEFLLNVKGLRLKPLSGRPGKLTLEIEGEKQVHASDITPSSDFEIVNPELYLATLDSSDAKLYVEFDVELSEGYREAESTDSLPVGVIPVDAIFSPMRKVNYTVEPIFVGQEASRERLRLEVWTDGTISPANAVSQSAEILAEQLAPFVNCSRQAPVITEEKPEAPSIPVELANMPVEQLNLSVRTMNCLRRGGIATVGELVSKTDEDLMALRNFGLKSKQELKERLESMGLGLRASPGSGKGGVSDEEQEEANVDEIIDDEE
jgi:DNA-directed RNA polymerase subunit alpha